MSDMRQQLLSIPVRGNDTIDGLVVERATDDRWVVNEGLHGYWTDIDGAVACIERGTIGS